MALLCLISESDQRAGTPLARPKFRSGTGKALSLAFNTDPSELTHPTFSWRRRHRLELRVQYCPVRPDPSDLTQLNLTQLNLRLGLLPRMPSFGITSKGLYRH